jgi:2-dehydrotetronate isomerase
MPRYSANISMLFEEVPFTERFGAAKCAGFEAVECWFPYQYSISTLRALLDGEGLALIGINTAAGDSASGEWGLAALPGREAEFKESVRQALDYATALGGAAIHVMASIVPRGLDSEMVQRTYLRNLEWALRTSEGADVTLLIEPLNQRDRPNYLLSRSDHAARIIERLANPRLKMLFDIYHVQISEGDIITRLHRHLPHIGHIQIAAVPTRAEPDEGELNYSAILAEVDRAGWRGWVGCEYRPRGGTVEGLGWRCALLTHRL